jgi:hypothetical protein
MTLQGRKTISVWRRTATAALASSGMALVLMLGSGPAIARADVFDDLGNEFSTASGAGQVSKLLNESLKLRAMGFRATKAETDGVVKSQNYRPNQTPMIHALQDAVAGQTHRMQQAQAAGGQGGYTVGINQYDPNSPGGVTAGGGGINLGGGNGSYTIGDGGAGTVPGGG